MKKHLLAISLFALCTTGLKAASPKKAPPEKKGVETINRATAGAHIGFLACDELEGREAGWKGGRLSLIHISLSVSLLYLITKVFSP